jgi:hypothetical protein
MTWTTPAGRPVPERPRGARQRIARYRRWAAELVTEPEAEAPAPVQIRPATRQHRGGHGLMDKTMTTEQEQRNVRLGALLVHLVTLILAVVMVSLAAWTLAVALAVVAAIAGMWAMKLYNDLREQAMQDRAMRNAAGRFQAPPPVDKFEG